MSDDGSTEMAEMAERCEKESDTKGGKDGVVAGRKKGTLVEIPHRP